MFEDRVRDHLHLVRLSGAIDERLVLLVITMLFNHTAPLGHIVIQKGNACLNLSFVVAEVEPFIFTLLDELLIRVAFILMPSHGAKDQNQLSSSRLGCMKRRLLGLLSRYRNRGLHIDSDERGR